MRLSVTILSGLLVSLPCLAEPAEKPDIPRVNDFEVHAGQKTFRLTEHRGHYVALHFLLKTECPFCLKYTRDYVQNGPRVAGVAHVFLKPDSEEEIRRWSGKLDAGAAEVDIYRDPDAALAERYGIPGGYSFHGQVVHYPALILIGPDGREVFRYVGRNNTDRFTFDRFEAKMAALSRHADFKEFNLGEGGLALKGYDAVSYFESGKPQMGRKELASTYRGMTFLFATPAHRKLFAAMPEKYAPAYGQWCAKAIAEGAKVDYDPASFKITNGRLFLFYKGWLGDALQAWNKDEARLTREADVQWRKLAPHDAPAASRPAS